MAKLLVHDTIEGVSVPFLRGILTRSLQDAGLPFDDAYQIASTVRTELHDVPEVTSEELRERVKHHLSPFGEAAVERYVDRFGAANRIELRMPDGTTMLFSRGRHALHLQCSGVLPETAADIAAHLHAELRQQNVVEIGLTEFKARTHAHLGRALGADAARRYLVWEDFSRSDRPLLLLLGGVTGCGKSTLATEVAHIVEIARTQSTDMLREVMRTIVPKRLLPVLHAHSFRAWEALPAYADVETPTEETVIAGYRTQAELLSVACEAAVSRALKERVSLILEGVHVQPSLAERIPADSEAIVVPLTLAVLKPTQLRVRLRGRGMTAPRRHAQHYLENFDSLWALQSHLLSEADRLGIPIIANDHREHTVQRVMGHVIDALARDFDAAPEEVFA